MNTKVNEGKLISGKEALIALANGESVQKKTDSWGGDCWLDISKKEPFNLDCFLSGLNRHGDTIKFRLKPRTITINGIEIPAPFKPTEDCLAFIIDDGKTDGWRAYGYEVDGDATSQFLGLWRTEEEIKQVVAALRQVFGGSHDN
ncbi:MAG: hypothetical protein DI631_13250 [Acinetobacter johnsonii]|nr:MAG: hypothetical protein DI631_13250 [Acinetobacter johnsonii]